jgi:hypothetical protein
VRDYPHPSKKMRPNLFGLRCGTAGWRRLTLVRRETPFDLGAAPIAFGNRALILVRYATVWPEKHTVAGSRFE